MSFQDWSDASWDKRGTRGRGESKKSVVNKAMREGNLATEKKYGAGGNKSAHTGAGVNMAKLEEDSENLKHKRVDKSMGQAIQQARSAKKMTQKALATAINEKPSVVAEYECGKAIPNPQIINKLERALGVKLPRNKKK